MAPVRKPKTNETISAPMSPPLNETAGTNGSSSQMTKAWKSSVRMTSATTERLATRARIAGRTSRLSAAMKTTASKPPPSSLICRSPGISQAVMLKAMREAISAISARLSSAAAPQAPAPQQLDLRAVQLDESHDGAVTVDTRPAVMAATYARWSSSFRSA